MGFGQHFDDRNVLWALGLAVGAFGALVGAGAGFDQEGIVGRRMHPKPSAEMGRPGILGNEQYRMTGSLPASASPGHPYYLPQAPSSADRWVTVSAASA